MQFEGEGWGRGKCSGVHKGSFNSWLRRLYESSWVISAVLWLQIQKHGPHPPKLPKTKGPLEDQLQTLVCLHILIVSWSSMIRSWYVLNMFWWLGDPAGCFLRRGPWCALRTARRRHRVEPFGPESSARTIWHGGIDRRWRWRKMCTLMYTVYTMQIVM